MNRETAKKIVECFNEIDAAVEDDPVLGQPHQCDWGQWRVNRCLMRSYADGYDILQNGKKLESPDFMASYSTYEIVEPKKYRPYTSKEAIDKIGCFINAKDRTAAALEILGVTATKADNFAILSNGQTIRVAGLFSDYQFLDGTTCGMEVK